MPLQLAYEVSTYHARHGAMGTGALATFLSNRLYLYRLKPLYAQNVVAGLNAEGANRALSYSSSRASRGGVCLLTPLAMPILPVLAQARERSSRTTWWGLSTGWRRRVAGEGR